MVVWVVVSVFLAISHTPIYSTRICCVHICSCLLALCILYFAYVDCATLPGFVFFMVFCLFFGLFLVLCWWLWWFVVVFCVFSTRRCFGLFSMVLWCLFGVGLRFGGVWCKFISCCSARLVLLG